MSVPRVIDPYDADAEFGPFSRAQDESFDVMTIVENDLSLTALIALDDFSVLDFDSVERDNQI